MNTWLLKTIAFAASVVVLLLSAACGSSSSSDPEPDPDPEPLPRLSISSLSEDEGNTGARTVNLRVTLSSLTDRAVSVSYETADGTAVAGADYEAAQGTITIAAGGTEGEVPITILGDVLDEEAETVTVTLSDPTNATLDTAAATLTIVDDDPAPSLSVTDTAGDEGNAGTTSFEFSIGLDAPSGLDVSVEFATADGTGTVADSDYEQTSGSVSIPAGQVAATVAVLVHGDSVSEGTETFSLSIFNATNATIVDGAAVGTIQDDDAAGPTIGLDSRPSNPSCIAPDRPSGNVSVGTEAAFPDLSFSQPVGLVQAPGDSSAWYVVEKAGRILRFANDAAATTTSVFLDIRGPGGPVDVAAGPSEAGLLGMAFHPDYASNRFVYLSYTVAGPGSGAPLTSVISRFVSNDNGATLDAGSELRLLTMDQPFENHNGGHIVFGPDAYLYIGFGDGGSSGDPGNRAQTTNNLFGTVLRIDVDSGTPYDIPGDNPFAGNPLCNDGAGPDACPEIYAWGLRNPWRFQFDSGTNTLWLADVGQNAWEEVDIVERGGNYGWRCREGAHDYNTSGNCPAGLIDPVMEYSHSIGNSITGGYVYRGAGIPELAGRYVFADFVQGSIFASVATGNGNYDFETLLNTSYLVSSFAVEATGELLVLDYGSGTIRRIVQAGGTSSDTIPDQLSQTGCVDPTDAAQPAEGLVPYDINAPFWSDGADKQRWYAIPDGATIDVDASGDWLFPVGTVLMKHFRLNGTLIETRLFMRHTDGSWAGYTYAWSGGNDAQRIVGGAEVSVGGQDWIYPSEAQCMACHTSAANFSLGLETGQLNRSFTYPSTGITANQLLTADGVDLLSAPLSDSVDNLARYANPADATASLQARSRSYLHSNCAGCHRPSGPTPSSIDLRASTPFDATGTCGVIPTSGDLGIANARIIAPGDAGASVLPARMNRRDVHGMPPLGSNRVDATGVTLVNSWIDSLQTCP